ncbi:LysR family transcriptional regulator [Streptomyces sp. TP-A0874]|uniref:LysR family transcriptional regulator n=1 Tax=Streptomyces sp. TP-A0874 TaxID=549819 RepID=UPI0008531950|nr:LysR family transcriptional regulator [Streptomyces sp. TP-A0874]
MPQDIDPRLLRAFVMVAAESNFTRAAARLHTAQQALSRDVRRLETALGTRLFDRTTRKVALTAEGERLLPYAERVLAAQRELVDAASGTAEGLRRPLLVDVAADASTGNRVLSAARRTAPAEAEFFARYYSGLTRAAADIAAGSLDVSFGRVAGLPAPIRARLDHLPVRYEPLAVLLPEGHRLADRETVPLGELAGEMLYAGAGNSETGEWTDLAVQLFADRGIRIAPPIPPIQGEAEFTRVMRKLGWPVLASVQFMAVPGSVLRPITDPVPLSPVSMVWRPGLDHPGLAALRAAAGDLAAAHGWLERPPGSWLPREEAERG